MKNQRIKILHEAKEVENISTSDLFDAVSKTEQQIVNLYMTAVKFPNREVKKKIMQLRTIAYELTTLIADVIDGESDVDLSDDPTNLDAKQPLDAPQPKEMIESIDLSEAYATVKEGINESDFADFQNVVVNKLMEAKSLGKEFGQLVTSLAEATTPKLYESLMNKIYDYADEHSIKIITE